MRRPTPFLMIGAVLACIIAPGPPVRGASADADAAGIAAKVAKVIEGERNPAKQAKLLYDAAELARDSKPLRAALLERAARCGTESRTVAGCRIAQTALERLSSEIPGKADVWLGKQIELHRVWYRLSQKPPDKEAVRQELGALLVKAAGRAEATRRWAEARAAYAEACTVLRISSRSDGLRHRQDRAAYFADARRRADGFVRRLESQPTDGAARSNLLQVLTLYLDSPAEAAKHLTGDVAESWRNHLPLAARPAAKLAAGQCKQLAAWYAESLAPKATSYAKANAVFRAKVLCERLLSLQPASFDAKLMLRKLQDELKALRSKGIWAIGDRASAVPWGAVLIMTFEENTFFKSRGANWVRDLSGKGNHGLVRGTSLAAGKAGRALSLSAKQDCVKVRMSDSLRFSAALTASAWVKPAGSEGCIASQHLHGITGNFVFGYWMGAFRFGRSAQPRNSSRICDGRWHHVVGVYDSTGRGIEHYVDAVRVKAFPEDNPVPRRDVTLLIGQQAGGRWRMRGLIDELALFDRALTAEEIRSLHEATAAGTSLVEYGH